MYSWNHNFKYSVTFPAHYFNITVSFLLGFCSVLSQISKRYTLNKSTQDNFERGFWQVRPQISWMLQNLPKIHCPLHTCLWLLPAEFQTVLLRLLMGWSRSVVNTLCIYLLAVVCWLITSYEPEYFQFLLGKCLRTLKEIMQNELNAWLQLHACHSLWV